MKFSIVVVIATLLFAFAAHFLLEDPGYVAINFRGYLVEMSVPVLLAIFVSLVFAVWAIRKLIIAPRLIGEAAGRYRSGRAGEKLTRGMIEVAEGNFARGEKLLARAASTSDAPLFNYLQAARAAHLQGSDDRRDMAQGPGKQGSRPKVPLSTLRAVHGPHTPLCSPSRRVSAHSRPCELKTLWATTP